MNNESLKKYINDYHCRMHWGCCRMHWSCCRKSKNSIIRILKINIVDTNNYQIIPHIAGFPTSFSISNDNVQEILDFRTYDQIIKFIDSPT
jgi:hypothetical protein